MSLFEKIVRIKTGLGKRLYPYYSDALVGTKTLLNLGSGDGVFSEYLRRKVPDLEVLDIDVVDANRVGRSPIIYDGKNIPLPNGSVEVVLCEFVLHHTNTHEHLVREIDRVCRREMIIVEDCANGAFDRLLCSVHGFFTRSMSTGGKANFRSREGWVRLFQEAGLKVHGVVKVPRKHNISYPVSRSIYFLAARSDKV